MAAGFRKNIFIGLGSNIGSREEYLKTAKAEMKKAGCIILQESKLYESEAWGEPRQAAFLNQVIEISADKEPASLLRLLKEIEKRTGRKKRGRWREREIDLDILLFDQTVVDTPDLQIPHRFLAERRFVLLPLAEIAGDFRVPTTGQSIRALLEQTTDTSGVTLFQDPEQPPE